MRRAQDTKQSYQDRREAYEGAVKLCSQDPSLYGALSALLLEHQETETALKWLQRGLAIAPNDPNLTLNEGVALLSAGQPEQALAILKKVPPTGRSEFYLGMAYRALREHKQAQQALLKAFRMGFDDPYILYVLIEQDRAMGEKEAGLRDFRTFYQRFPDSVWLHMLYGDAYLARNEDSSAEAEYEQALKIKPNLPVVHYQLGFIAFKRAKYSAAEDHFRKEIALNPTFAAAYLYLGTTLRRLGKDAEGLSFLGQAVTRDPNDALAYSELATAQIQAGRLEAALRTLKAAKARFPQQAAFAAQLAGLLRHLGHGEEANREAEKATRLSRKNNPIQHGLRVEPDSGAPRPPLKAPLTATSDGVSPALKPVVQCLARSDAKCAAQALAAIQAPVKDSGDYLEVEARTFALERRRDEALAAIQQALRKQPNRYSYLMTQGRIYQSFNDQASAIRSFLRAGEMEPGSPDPLYFLGMSFFLLGEYYNSDEYYNRAEPHFKAALECDPQADRAEFMLGVIDVMRNRLIQAKPHFQKAIHMNEQNADYHLQYGILLRRLMDFTEALAEMRVAEKLNPNHPLVHFNLGSLEQQMGNYREAREQLEAAVRLNPRLPEAYYSLGGVYHHLGLEAKAKEAYHRFELEKAHQQKEDSAPSGTRRPSALPSVSHQ